MLKMALNEFLDEGFWESSGRLGENAVNQGFLRGDTGSPESVFVLVLDWLIFCGKHRIDIIDKMFYKIETDNKS